MDRQPEQSLAKAVSQFDRLQTLPRDEDEAFHLVVAGMHSLCKALRRAELSGLNPKKILELAGPARVLHSASPFVNRIQTWPRGYPGDFETIEYLCDQTVKAESQTLAWYIERHALERAIAQQHRNKLSWQAQAILSHALRKKKARMLSIACGASRDLQSIQHHIADTGAKIWLNDWDAAAVERSLRVLEQSAFKIHAVVGDVFRSLKRLQSGAPFDLILAGGLFDYLSDRQIVWLIPKLYELLAPDGALCFTNTSKENSDRVWIEYLGNWHLKERDESDIQRLISESQINGLTTSPIRRESTGLTHLVEISRRQ
jgi:hypothetical protein